MSVTCHNVSVKTVTVEDMYKHRGLVCQFELSVRTYSDSPEEHRLLVLLYHSKWQNHILLCVLLYFNELVSVVCMWQKTVWGDEYKA